MSKVLRSVAAILAAALFLSVMAASAADRRIDPAFTGLVAQDGAPVEESRFAGHYRLVAFGFLNCPDVCPLTLTAMKLTLETLGPEAVRLQPVFISVDPRRDTPALLAAYARHFDPRILALSGNPDATRRVADHYAISYYTYDRKGADKYLVAHTTRLSLIAPDGRLVATIAAEQAPQAIAQGVSALLRSDALWIP